MPMRRRSVTSWASGKVPISVPSTSTRPSVGCSSRLMVRSRLDLPAPLRPMMPKMLPAGMDRLMSCSACTGPVEAW